MGIAAVGVLIVGQVVKIVMLETGGGTSNQDFSEIPLDTSLLKVDESAYGSPIKKILGRSRAQGNIIWSRDIEEVITVTSTTVDGPFPEEGGKGGGNIYTTTNITRFSYFATFAVGVCAGEISNILKIWADTKLIYDIDTTDRITLIQSAKLPMAKYYGSESQIPSSVIEGFDGTGNVTAYRGLAYVVFNKLHLADFGNRIPSLTFEVQA